MYARQPLAFEGTAHDCFVLDLHSLGIVHTDIKPDNIVFKNTAVVTVRELHPEQGYKPKVGRICLLLLEGSVLLMFLQRILVSTELRIVDLGCAVSPLQTSAQISVGHSLKPGMVGYRAPEVTLGESLCRMGVRVLIILCMTGLPWSFEIDSFGIGCVLAEATMLCHVFDGHCDNDREYLATID